MGSLSGTSSGSSLLRSSASEEDLQQLMDQRKRKRMISNRESARRSRMRKQKHLDDLTAQVAQLRRENNQIITGISVTTQQYLNVEGENSILRAQLAELSHRLESLNEIVSFLNAGNGYLGTEPFNSAESGDEFSSNSWNCVYLNQPIMASTDLLQY
ncbi:bZIP transcription factor 11-like [Actinidia eriantha]|uniref:bZIP transcription factor 11-like n=1 Tax=Actinidia eriantha TaxID=165200 RepID=UPI00258D803C|nr:bZIP transcription factor 11-like [Actinidia eriantha]